MYLRSMFWANILKISEFFCWHLQFLYKKNSLCVEWASFRNDKLYSYLCCGLVIPIFSSLISLILIRVRPVKCNYSFVNVMTYETHNKITVILHMRQGLLIQKVVKSTFELCHAKTKAQIS